MKPRPRALINGVVLTSDSRHPVAQALAWQDGRIRAVGTTEEIREFTGTAAEITDLEGRCVIPGLTDCHVHLLRHALWSSTVELRDSVDPAVTSIEVIAARMAERDRQTSPGNWVIGTGAYYQEQRLREGRLPDRRDLDAAVPAHPAYIRFGAHVTVANSLALQHARISAQTPDPPGGRIVRFAGTNEPSGLLLEQAQSLVAQDVDSFYSFSDYKDAGERALLACAARGVTCLHEIINKPEQVIAYQELASEGRLPVRVSMLIRVLNAEFDPHVLTGLGLRAGFGDDRLWLGGAKLSIDGDGEASYWGITRDGQTIGDPIIRVDRETLFGTVREYHERGIRVCVHALGDAAVDMALDAFEKAGTAGSGIRHRIEHFGNWLCTPERLERCRALGVVPVPNPPFLWSDGEAMIDLLGDEHIAGMFPYRTLLEAGIPLAGGSDSGGYYEVDGFRDLSLYVTRQTRLGYRFPAAEALSVEEALYAQTATAAWLGYQEHVAGALTPGKHADFVVLGCGDLRAVEPAALAATPVDATVVAGDPVYGSLG